MQPDVMLAASLDVIHDHPAMGSEPLHRPAVLYAKAFIAIVLTLKAVSAGAAGRRINSAFSLRPIEPEKATGSTHLVLIIDCHGVVDSSSREPIIPRWRSVVEICSGIARQVNTLPPQIHVQLICLKRPANVAAGANHRPGILVAQTEISGFNGRWRRDRRLLHGRRCDAEPEHSLIPRSWLECWAIQNGGA